MNPEPKVLIVCQADKQEDLFSKNMIKTICEFLTLCCDISEEEIIQSSTLTDAREKFLGNYRSLRVIFVDIDVPSEEEDSLINLTEQIARSVWPGTLVACSKNDELYEAGCRTHFGYDQRQSLTYVIRARLEAQSARH